MLMDGKRRAGKDWAGRGGEKAHRLRGLDWVPRAPSLALAVVWCLRDRLLAAVTMRYLNRMLCRRCAAGFDRPGAISVEWNAKTDEEKAVRAMRCPRRRTRDSTRAIARPFARRDALIG